MSHESNSYLISPAGLKAQYRLRPISWHRDFQLVASGNFTAALMLSHFVYWLASAPEGGFRSEYEKHGEATYICTREAWEKTYDWSPKQTRIALEILKAKKYVRIELYKTPWSNGAPISHYFLNEDRVFEDLAACQNARNDANFCTLKPTKPTVPKRAKSLRKEGFEEAQKGQVDMALNGQVLLYKDLGSKKKKIQKEKSAAASPPVKPASVLKKSKIPPGTQIPVKRKQSKPHHDPNRKEFADLVILTFSEYDTFVRKWGKEVVDKAVELLSEWKKLKLEADPTFLKRYKFTDAGRLQKWAIGEARKRLGVAPPLEGESNPIENRKWAQDTFGKLDGAMLNTFRLEILSKGVVFDQPGAVHSQYKEFLYVDPHFRSKLESFVDFHRPTPNFQNSQRSYAH